MKYYVDTKHTIWRREHYEFPDSMAEEDVLEGIDNTDGENSEYDFETVEDMTVVENNGCATREIYNENHECISTNEKH